jgi:hypothetical protein
VKLLIGFLAANHLVYHEGGHENIKQQQIEIKIKAGAFLHYAYSKSTFGVEVEAAKRMRKLLCIKRIFNNKMNPLRKKTLYLNIARWEHLQFEAIQSIALIACH